MRHAITVWGYALETIKSQACRCLFFVIPDSSSRHPGPLIFNLDLKNKKKKSWVAVPVAHPEHQVQNNCSWDPGGSSQLFFGQQAKCQAWSVEGAREPLQGSSIGRHLLPGPCPWLWVGVPREALHLLTSSPHSPHWWWHSGQCLCSLRLHASWGTTPL